MDLTYTSNAIEGNTLTLRETAELIEHGITVGGKPLRDHLEAVDHYNAVLWMRELADQAAPVDETTVPGICTEELWRAASPESEAFTAHCRAALQGRRYFPQPVEDSGTHEEFW